MSHDLDPAVLRGAPLGWHFPLFFVVHAFMPTGAVVAYAMADIEDLGTRLAVIGAGASLSLLILTLLLQRAFAARRRIQGFRALRGAPVLNATVIEVLRVGTAGTRRRAGRRTNYVKLWTRLAVHSPAGPFEVGGEARYTSLEQANLWPGTVVRVAFSPAQPEEFMVLPESIPMRG